VLFGSVLLVAAAASFLLQPGPGTSEIDVDAAARRAMVAYREERIDPASVAALVDETGILAHALDRAPVAARSSLESPPLSVEEAERQLGECKARAKDRLKALKALGQWAKDYQEAHKTHSKQLEKLADTAASTIVHLFGPGDDSVAAAEPPSKAATARGEGHNTTAQMDVPRCEPVDRDGLAATTPLQLWCRSLAGHTRHRSREASALGDLGADTLLETATKLGAEQALLEKRCSAHGNALVLDRQKAAAAKAAADRAQTAAEERFRAHVEKMVG
jgi:hypothetical protein